MSNETDKERESTGIHFHGSGRVTIGGSVVGRDMFVIAGNHSSTPLHVFGPLLEAVREAAPETQLEAQAKIEALKDEVAKGKTANDSVMRDLLRGIVGLVPGAVKSIVQAFANPLLIEIAGKSTRALLDEWRIGS